MTDCKKYVVARMVVPDNAKLVCYSHFKIKLVQATLNNCSPPPKKIKGLFGGGSIFAIFSSRLGLDKQKKFR